MAGLIEVATVLHGDGTWASGYDAEALACGFSVDVVDPCDPGRTSVSTVTPPDGEMGGWTIPSFAIVSEMIRANRCVAPEDRDRAQVALVNATERAVGMAFWGDPGMASLVTLDDGASVAPGTSVEASLVALLDNFYSTSALYHPIVHMGLANAFALQELLTEDMRALRTGERVCISVGYPVDGLAVTGPITIHLGSIETMVNYDASHNRTSFEATRLGSIEFDPCAAARIAVEET